MPAMASTPNSRSGGEYSESSIRVLKGQEPVRQRPGAVPDGAGQNAASQLLVSMDGNCGIETVDTLSIHPRHRSP